MIEGCFEPGRVIDFVYALGSHPRLVGRVADAQVSS
jgi:hypothetical protein